MIGRRRLLRARIGQISCRSNGQQRKALRPNWAYIEIENNASASLEALVAALNGKYAAQTYSNVDTGAIGTDAIKVGFIYKPATVSLACAHAILDSSVDPLFLDRENRLVVAQTFQEVATGEKVTIAVNHL